MIADEKKLYTGKEIKDFFANLPDDAKVSFGHADKEYLGALTLHRLKIRGENFINVEFNETFNVACDPYESD